MNTDDRALKSVQNGISFLHKEIIKGFRQSNNTEVCFMLCRILDAVPQDNKICIGSISKLCNESKIIKSVLEKFTPLPGYQIEKLHICIVISTVLIQILSNPQDVDKIIDKAMVDLSHNQDE